MNPAPRNVALITGASRGIGKAIALRLARSGTKVALTGRHSVALESARREIQEAGGIALSFEADATDARRAVQVIERCQAELGPIDLLVNNAGLAGNEGPIGKWDLDAQWRIVEVNLRGPIVYANALVPFMRERGAGCIVNLGSYASILPRPKMPVYAASKAALTRLFDSLAPALKEHGIQLFTVSPGLVRTEMTDALPHFDDVPDAAWSPVEDVCELVARLATGNYASLSGRFIHVKDDLERLARHAARIEAEGLYQLRLPGLDGWIG